MLEAHDKKINYRFSLVLLYIAKTKKKSDPAKANPALIQCSWVAQETAPMNQSVLTKMNNTVSVATKLFINFLPY